MTAKFSKSLLPRLKSFVLRSALVGGAMLGLLVCQPALGIPCKPYEIEHVCPGVEDPPICDDCSCPPPDKDKDKNDKKDNGNDKNKKSGCRTCGSQTEELGLPTWWVSEPRINLRIEDRPLAYGTGRGAPVVLRLSYQQGGAIPQEDEFFSLGPKWSCSFRSHILVTTNAEDEIFIAQHDGGAGVIAYYGLGTAHPRNGRNVTTADGVTWIVTHPDGARDIYSIPFTNSLGDVYRFLERRLDTASNVLSFSYTYTNSGAWLLLTNVTDADGYSCAIAYNTDTNFPNRIASVTDPYGRSCSFQYDQTTGFLTNVTDVQGIASGFGYGTYGIETLVTPYGTNTFEHGGSALSESTTSALFESYNGANRYVRVTQPDGGKQLFVYRQDCSGLVTNSYAPLPSTSPLTNWFDNVDQSQANSFHWDERQYAAVSTNSVDSMTAADYALARQWHWLLDAGSTNVSSLALSNERAPSPDGATRGQITWYDYAGKAAANEAGSSAMPLFVAQVLPNGETAFEYTERNGYHAVSRSVETYTKTDGSVGLRTNTFTFAGNGQDMVQHVGPEGSVVVSNYFNNAYHQPDASYDALGQETRFTYNASRQLTSIQRPSGLTTTNVYFSSGAFAGWLEKTIDLEIARTNAYTYSYGLIYSHTDERGLTTTNYFDNLQRLTGVTFPDGTTTSNRFTLLDRIATKDRLGNWSYSGFNSVRQLIAHTNANGTITRYGYCSCGSVTSVTNAWSTAAESVTSYVYDYQGNLIYTYQPDVTITNWFDALGRLQVSCDPWGCRWHNYNNQGLLISVTNSLGGTEQTVVYDIENRPLWVTAANGVTVTNSYDALGRLRTRTYPDGGLESFGYSGRGMVAYTNQLSLTNYYVYDEAGRKVFETNANAEVIRYTNNAAGDLLALVDGKNQVTKWNYDEYGRVTNKVDQAATEILRYKYDPNSRLTNHWSAAKGDTKYKYDSVGNMTNVDYAVSTDLSFAYDWLNRLTNMIDAVGTTKYTYSTAGRLLTEDGPWSSDTVTNTYSSGLRTDLNLAQPTGQWTNLFAYDAAKRLTNVTSTAGAILYSFVNLGSRLSQKLSLPNTSYITNTYDNVARLTGTWLKNGSHTTLDSATYGYNAGNQRTTFTNAAGTYVSHTYDRIGQLQVADSSVNSEDRGYAYDTAWNLNYRTNNGTLNTFTVDGKNQLTNSTPGGVSTFDGNGNTLSEFTVALKFGYDDENQLINVTNSANELHVKRTKLTYDGKLRLRLRQEYEWEEAPPEFLEGPGGDGTWILLSETRYLYDGMRVIQERDANNTPTVSYTRGTDLSGSLEGAGGIGGLLARSHGYSSGNWSTNNFYHADGNGNITYLVNASQTEAASYRYDPFGNTTASSGTLASANVYRFSSKEAHANSGFYYYGYRWYAPSLQRWLNRDPIDELGFTLLTSGRQPIPTVDVDDDEPGIASTSRSSRSTELNLYAFVENRPTTEVDPFGLFLGFGYGNWCGWSRRGEGGDPIDAVDAACKKHDNCLATPLDACKFKFCNVRFCKDVAKANCHGDKACKKAKRTILIGCGIIVPIPPFIFM